MTERELGKALLNAPSASPPPAGLAANVLRRDRRLVNALATLTAVLWLLAAGSIGAFYYMFMTFIFPRINEALTNPAAANDPRLPQQWQTIIDSLRLVGHPLIVASLVAVALAALATVALVYLSRRATLRQINAVLADISAQLRQMQPPRTGQA